MINKKIIKVWILVLIVFAQIAFGAGKVAQSKMQFIKIGVGGRSTAMGDAYTAQAGDPFCVFYNPAGLAFVKSSGISINKTNWIADISHMAMAATYSTDRYGVFSFNVINMDYGEMTRTIVDGHSWKGYLEDGTFSVSEFALGMGYAKNVTDRVALGGQVKYFHQDFGDVETFIYPETSLEDTIQMENKDNFLAFDFGTFYKTGYKDFQIGMSVQNFANRAIPLTFRFGVSINLAEVIFPDIRSHKLIIAADALHPRDYDERIHIGMEYGYMDKMFLRSGYKFNYDEEGLTMGAGLNLRLMKNILRLEYSYTDFGRLGYVARYSMGFSF